MIVLTKLDMEIHIHDTENGKRGVFSIDGNKISGELEMNAKDVRYKAWKQGQGSFSETKLRKCFEELDNAYYSTKKDK